MSRALALLGALAVSAPVRAELPPGSYDELRADAEEAVTIQVTTVARGADGPVGLKAKVLGVEHSKSGLKKGDAISIKYAGGGKKKVGPAPVPLLEGDEVYPAFLNKKGDEFEPAAHGWSFKMIPEAIKAEGGKAERFGRAVLKVEEMFKLNPADPKMAEVRREVIQIGQSGDEMYCWVQSRLGEEVQSLKNWIRDAHPKPEEEKKLKAKIEFLGKVGVEIDAPK